MESNLIRLRNKRCKPCEGGVDALNRTRASLYLEQVPGWTLDGDGKNISRTFEFSDFSNTMKFVNDVAKIAEEQDHHPDFCAGYRYCTVRYTTHAINGLSENDFICAAIINELPEH